MKKIMLFVSAILLAGIINAQETNIKATTTTNLGDYSGTAGDYNAFIGYQSGKVNTSLGDYNTFLGAYTGYKQTSGKGNTFLGYKSGYNNLSGGYNVFIGRYAGYNETQSNKLYIDNSTTSSPLVWGDFLTNVVNINGSLGVNTPSPEELFHVTSSSSSQGAGMKLTHFVNEGSIIQQSHTIENQEGNLFFRDNANTTYLTLANSGNATFTKTVTALDFVKADGSSIGPWAINGHNTYYNAGNVGIGTDAPNEKLHIKSDLSSQGAGMKLTHFINEGSVVEMSHTIENVGGNIHFKDNNNSTYLTLGSNGYTTFANTVKVNNDIISNGRVGIGSLVNFNVDPNAKLLVDGKISCEEIEVMNIGADFVFEEDYNLMSIADLEDYVKTHKHLPEIAPASETEKGVELAQFTEKLLQKIEELTLYTIELQNQINEMKETK